MKVAAGVFQAVRGINKPQLAFDQSAHGSIHNFLAPVPLPFHLPTPVYGAMLAIWHLRPMLQRRLPLHQGKDTDFIRLLAWAVSEGRRKYAILRSIEEWDSALGRPISLPPVKGDRWSDGFSVAMFLFGLARHGYTFGPMFRDAAARHQVACAYWRGERHERHLPAPSPWQHDFLADRFGSTGALLDTIRIDNDDRDKGPAQLCEEFGLADIQQSLDPRPDGTRPVRQASRPEAVLLPAGIRRFHDRLPQKILRSNAWMVARLRPRPTEFQLASITGRIASCQRSSPQSVFPFGVNLFGYANGELGIGEDVRLVAQALKTQDIPFCIVNVPLGANVSQQDTSVDDWIVKEPRYAINIFCTTGIEHTRYACTNGLDVFRGRYTIGLWPWELPDWPVSCNHAFSVVDEIWGISRYTANAYRGAPCPVHAMSLPVTVDAIEPQTRASFGLPEKDYLFVFSFDCNSSLARKNPAGVVRAFQRAFPRSESQGVGLVLKASHVNTKNKEWRRLKRMMDADPRIHLIDTMLRRPQILALYKCCDCYVSLHRAEGFGRSLAEALLLDLQLIATGYSGNMDFCTDERVALVPFQGRDLEPGEYLFADGQCWADPDIRRAAELMRDIRANPRTMRQRDLDFSPATVGARYAQRLLEIKKQLDL